MLRARPLVLLLVSPSCASDPPIVDATTSGSSSTVDDPSTEATTTPSTSTSESSGDAADTSGSTTPSEGSSEGSESGGSSGESGGPPDCFATEGCSCVLGLCAYDFAEPPLVCEDDTCIAPACGNGEIDRGEVCDDGNGDPTDECTTECVPPACGDGVLRIQGELCDGVPGSPCGVACDAAPIQTTGLDVASGCALAAAPNGTVYFVLGSPTNRLTSYDGEGAEVWQVDVVGGDARAVGARQSGEIVVGVTAGDNQPSSTLQRFAADGAPLGTVDLAVEQRDEYIEDIEVQADDTWVLSRANFAADAGNHLCRYDEGWTRVWCTEILEGDDPFEEQPVRFALSSTGDAAISMLGNGPVLWLVDADGDVALAADPARPPLASAFLGAGIAFTPDDNAVTLGWAHASTPTTGLHWGVYSLDATPQRYSESRIRDAQTEALVAYTPSGDLVVGNVVDLFDQVPYVFVEGADGEPRYARRGPTIPGSTGEPCDMLVTNDAIVLAGTTTASDRWFVTRFPIG